MRIFTTILLAVLFASTGFAQDKLVLTNGKIKNIKGEVVYTDHEEVRYQRKDEKERELRRLERLMRVQKRELKKASEGKRYNKDLIRIPEGFSGHVWELFAVKDSVNEIVPGDFGDEIKQKMEELDEQAFETWKLERYQQIRMQELFATIGGNKAEKRMLALYTKRKKRDLVFSILKPDGTEIVVYSPDTLGFLAEDTIPDLEYGVAEMRAYMQGRRDGRKHRAGDAWIGGGVGTISAFGGAFYGPIGPAAYIGVMTFFNSKLQDRAVSDKSLKDVQAYVDGYERSAKNKKVRNFAIGSLVGLGVGFGLYQVTFR